MSERVDEYDVPNSSYIISKKKECKMGEAASLKIGQNTRVNFDLNRHKY